MNIRECFECGPGEKVPKVDVRRNGRQRTYEELQCMDVRDLMTYRIRIFDTPFAFDRKSTSWGKCNLGVRCNSDENAANFLERAYHVCEAMLVGI